MVLEISDFPLVLISSVIKGVLCVKGFVVFFLIFPFSTTQPVNPITKII